MSSNLSITEISNVISKIDKVVVAAHYNPDADAYGSSSAMAMALSSIGKDVVLFNETGLVEGYEHIPGVEKLVSTLPLNYTNIISLDCGGLNRLGESFRSKAHKFERIVNIDHHVSNDLFGTHNLVLGDASSTCEIVFNILKQLKITISKEIATALFTGISADTGSFAYSSTRASTFAIAEELVKLGASPAEIAVNLYQSNSLPTIMLQSEALSKLKLHCNGALVEILVDDEMYKRHHATSENTEGIVDRARSIKGVRVALFIYREDGLWKISLRSKDPAVDLSKVAATFGGGGHRAAAAFRWKKDLEELRPKILDALENALLVK